MLNGGTVFEILQRIYVEILFSITVGCLSQLCDLSFPLILNVTQFRLCHAQSPSIAKHLEEMTQNKKQNKNWIKININYFNILKNFLPTIERK